MFLRGSTYTELMEQAVHLDLLMHSMGPSLPFSVLGVTWVLTLVSVALV